MSTHLLRSRVFLVSKLLASLIFLQSGRATEPKFVGLGDLPGGKFRSVANAVSSDGFTIVGSAQSSRSEAFMWRGGKMIGLGTIPGGTGGSEATCVSGDGSIVVGFSSSRDSQGDPWRQAFRWTQDSGMKGLGDLGGGFCASGRPHSEANAISDDGKVIVGTTCASKLALNGRRYSRYAAFRWTAQTGLQPYADFFDDAGWSRCLAVSGDGNVAVGIADDNFQRTRLPVLWSLGQVTSVLPRTRQARATMTGTAFAVSDDGTTVAGVVAQGRNASMFVWQALTGMQRIESLTFPRALTRDGSQLVGELTTENGDVAVVWDAQNGIRHIADILRSEGLELAGWKLIQATDISADGTIVVGNGTNPQGKSEAWMARIR